MPPARVPLNRYRGGAVLRPAASEVIYFQRFAAASAGFA
jgi:hypothetical protein